MNLLYQLRDRSARLHGTQDAQHRSQREKERKAIAEARQLWLDKLTVDQTRAWMEIDVSTPGVLNGLTALLTLAGLAKAFDDKHQDSPEVRVIRGAISAAEQCGKGGAVMTPAFAQAFHSAVNLASGVIKTCTAGAIAHASNYLSQYVNGGSNGAVGAVA